METLLAEPLGSIRNHMVPHGTKHGSTGTTWFHSVSDSWFTDHKWGMSRLAPRRYFGIRNMKRRRLCSAPFLSAPADLPSFLIRLFPSATWGRSLERSTGPFFAHSFDTPGPRVALASLTRHARRFSEPLRRRKGKSRMRKEGKIGPVTTEAAVQTHASRIGPCRSLPG